MTDTVLELDDLTKVYRRRLSLSGGNDAVRAVDGVSLSVGAGETVALVGESGSGKSTLARMALRLIDPTSGAVRFDGVDVTQARGRRLRALRRHVSVVFQDPYTSLNPRQNVTSILSNVLRNFDLPRDRGRLVELVEAVGLTEGHLDRYPHEFSGGQRQRIGIARALATDPRLIVADEPVSALDVSIRAQILNLLADLRDQRGLALLIVSHDLAVVRSIADRVAVMHDGRVVESGDTERVYADPQEKYTRALLAAVPLPDPHQRTRPLG